jgi:hypothetical protein
MDTLIRLCKLSLTGGSQWALEDFTDDPKLDAIDVRLRSTIMSGKNFKLTGFCQTISVIDVQNSTDNVISVKLDCISGYNTETKSASIKKFIWTIQQLKLFLDYLDNNKIEAC